MKTFKAPIDTAAPDSVRKSPAPATRETTAPKAAAFAVDQSPRLVRQMALIASLRGDAAGGPSGVRFAVRPSPVVQRGAIKKTDGQDYVYGLVHGKYSWSTNNADMHVSKKEDDGKKSTVGRNVFDSLTWINKMMLARQAEKGPEGTLDWNPQGAAVIKLVGELLGESLGGGGSLEEARAAKAERKKGPAPLEMDDNIMDEGVVPEHVAYLQSLRGRGARVSAVLNGELRDRQIKYVTDHPQATQQEISEYSDSLLENQKQDMTADTPAGAERLAAYKAHLEAGKAVSLSIRLTQSSLPAMLAKMRSM